MILGAFKVGEMVFADHNGCFEAIVSQRHQREPERAAV